MPICAYCKRDGTMTREHVIPSFAYAVQQSTASKPLGWSEPAKKMVGGEMKVKDVCETCNSGVLSVLDTYGKSLLQAAGILVRDFPHRSLALEYDYDRLARWLLKISFNSSRTDGAHAHLFDEHIPYMLGSAATPSRSRLAIICYLAAPASLKSNREGVDVRNPFLVRIAYGLQNARYTTRIVGFGPLYFYLLLFRDHTLPGHAAVEIRSVLKGNTGAAELKPSQGYLHLHSGAKSWLDLYEFQVARTRHYEKDGSKWRFGH